MKLLRNRVDLILMHQHILFVAFEEKRRGAHLMMIKTLQFGDVELFEAVDEALKERALLGLERLPEAELFVVEEANGGGRALLSGHLSHEFDAIVKSRENNRAVFDHLWQGSDFERGLGYDAQGALGAEHELVDVGSVAETRHLAVLLDCAAWRHDCHVHEKVLDVAVLVLFHA